MRLADVINCAKYPNRITRDFDFAGVEFLAFPWERDVAVQPVIAWISW